MAAEGTEALDEHYFALSALVTVALQLLCFLVAYTCAFDKITDFAGSTNFSLLALLTLGLNGTYHTRQVVLTVFVVVSRSELACFLLLRVLKRKKDARFDEMRSRFFAFLGFWVFQMVWAFGVTLPVIFVNGDDANPELDGYDVAGWVVFALGFTVEVLADVQKYRFRADPANRGTFCAVGLWSVSRHPNYFGEILIWWGIFIATLPVVLDSTQKENIGWIGLTSPLLTMLILLFLSGLPSAEGAALARYYKDPEVGRRWDEYARTTSPVVPMPTALYTALPSLAKAGLFCEFPFLRFTEEMQHTTGDGGGSGGGGGGGGGGAGRTDAV